MLVIISIAVTLAFIFRKKRMAEQRGQVYTQLLSQTNVKSLGRRPARALGSHLPVPPFTEAGWGGWR